MVTITRNPDGSFTVRYDADAQAVWDRVVGEHAGRLSEIGLLDNLFTNWFQQQRQRHETDDFANLTPKQRKTAINAGKNSPR